jgi:hypothetical protein
MKVIFRGNAVLDQSRKNASGRIVARGIIVPSRWDKVGNITTLSFLTDDEREFVIEAWSDIVADFSVFDKRPVIISGIQKREESKIPVIEISSLEILDSMDQ